MHHWFGLALVAYLLGAAIEGITTANNLTHSVSELAAEEQERPSEPDDSTHHAWQVFAVIAVVSLLGAILWPCRLLHRSLKAKS